MDNLKPCPFCGNEHITVVTRKPVGMGEYFVIKCTECSAEMTRSTKRKAVEAWNRRKDGADDDR